MKMDEFDMSQISMLLAGLRLARRRPRSLTTTDNAYFTPQLDSVPHPPRPLPLPPRLLLPPLPRRFSSLPSPALLLGPRGSLVSSRLPPHPSLSSASVRNVPSEPSLDGCPTQPLMNLWVCRGISRSLFRFFTLRAAVNRSSRRGSHTRSADQPRKAVMSASSRSGEPGRECVECLIKYSGRANGIF